MALRCRCDGGRLHRPYHHHNREEAEEEEEEEAVGLLMPPADVALLFSGGVDSTLLAALVHQVSKQQRNRAPECAHCLFARQLAAAYFSARNTVWGL